MCMHAENGSTHEIPSFENRIKLKWVQTVHFPEAFPQTYSMVNR